MPSPAFPYPACALVIDPVLIRKYDVSGPRYASYPTADRFAEAFGETQLRQWLGKRNIGGICQPLSVYIHLPAQYIDYLAKELALLAPLLGTEREICQLHLGGDTPTFLPPGELKALAELLARHFTRAEDAEYAIEVDPRATEPGTLRLLGELGFNRVSIGVQDLDPAVQRAVHRIQSEEVTRRVIEEARSSGFRSVNLDLIYGLPKQTLDSFSRTLDRVIDLAPDRIALYSYAHLPKAFLPQRRIADADVPSAERTLQIMTLAIGRLLRAGFLHIGMDHFARPHDELALAQSRGRLQRNLQGYSTYPDSDLIGLGVSAIGRIGPTYYQNQKELPAYYAALDAGRLPMTRGIELTQDDLARRAIIQALACHACVSIESIELSYLVDFRKEYAQELRQLRDLEKDGLVEVTPEWIAVTPRGRLLVRAICMVFDRYLRDKRSRATYSKVL